MSPPSLCPISQDSVHRPDDASQRPDRDEPHQEIQVIAPMTLRQWIGDCGPVAYAVAAPMVEDRRRPAAWGRLLQRWRNHGPVRLEQLIVGEKVTGVARGAGPLPRVECSFYRCATTPTPGPAVGTFVTAPDFAPGTEPSELRHWPPCYSPGSARKPVPGPFAQPARSASRGRLRPAERLSAVHQDDPARVPSRFRRPLRPRRLKPPLRHNSTVSARPVP